MAEYRGLTIRIGADVSRFTQALKATQSAIAATQKNLTQLKKALVMDPGSKNAAAMYIGEMQSQAVAASSKVALLKKNIADMSNTIAKGPKGNYTTVGLLAEQTENAALSAGRAKAAYTDVTDALAQVYTKISELSHQTFDVSSEDRKQMIADLRAMGLTAQEAREKVNDLINDTVQGQTFNVNNSSISAIEAELKRLVEGDVRKGVKGETISIAGVLDAEEAKETLATIERLKTVWQQFSDRNDSARMVNDIHNAQVEVEKLNAQIKANARQMTESAARSSLTQGLEDDLSALRNLGTEAENAQKKLELVDDAFKLDPKNIDVIAQRTISMQDAMDAARAKAEQLESILNKYRDAGIDKVASDTGNLTQALDDAVAKTTAANEEVIRLQGELDQSEAKRSAAIVDGTATIMGASEEYQNLRERLNSAKEAAAAATDEMNKLKDAVDFDARESELAEVNNTIKELGNMSRETAQYLKSLAEAEVAVVSGGIESGFNSIVSDLEVMSQKADDASSRFEALDKAMQAKPTNIERVKERTDALRDAVQAARDRAEELDRQISGLKAQGFDAVISKTKNLATATANAEAKWKAARAAVKLYSEQLARARSNSDTTADEIDNLEKQLNEASEAAKKAGESFRELYGASTLQGLERMSSDATGALAEFEQQSKTTFDDFSTSTMMVFQEVGQYARQAVTSVVDATVAIDDALTSVRKTVDGTEEQYQDLKDAAIESSKVQPIDAATILEAEALGGQLGFNIRQVEEFARVATGLDVSTNMGWEDASTYMAQFFNIFDTNKNLVSNYGSTIVDLGNKFATTEEDIAMMSARIASAGTSIGMSEADVLGLSAALSSMGVKAEAGGSSISTIMTNIDKSVALGTDGIKEYADQAGMTVSDFIEYLRSLDEDGFEEVAKSYNETSRTFEENTIKAVESLEAWASAAHKDSAQFAKDWLEDPISALMEVFSGLDEATDQGGNLALMLDELGITSIRQLDLSRRMASNSDLVAKAIKTANTAWAENIALDKEVERKNESLSAQMDIMKNSFDAVKAELGEGLLPIVQLGVGFMQEFSHVLDGMSDSAKTGVISFLGLSGGIATTYPIFSKVFNFFSDFPGKMATFVSNASAAGGVMGNLITGIGTFAATIGPVGAVVGALAVAIGVTYVNHVLKAREQQNKFNDALQSMSGVSKDVKASFETTSDYAKTTAKSIEELTEQILEHNEAIQKIGDNYRTDSEKLEMYKDVIDEVGKSVRGVAEEDIPADKLADLEWAIDGVNQQLGTQFELQDFINGQYEDEQGEIQDTIDSIDRLIAARRRDAQAQADKTMYERAMTDRLQAEKDLEQAKKAYEEQEKLLAERKELTPNLDENLIKESLRLQGLYSDGVIESYEAAQKALEGYVQDELYYKGLMENNAILSAEDIDVDTLRDALNEAGLSTAAYATLTADELKKMVESADGDMVKLVQSIAEANGIVVESLDDVREAVAETATAVEPEANKIAELINGAFRGWDIEWKKALEEGGTTVEEFAQKAEEAGIKVEDLKSIYDDPDVFFSQYVKDSIHDGVLDIDELIAKIDEYNGKDFEEKEVKVNTSQAKLDLDEARFEKDLANASFNSDEYSKQVNLTLNSTDAEKKLDSFRSLLSDVPDQKETYMYAYTDTAVSDIQYVITLANSIPQWKTIHVNLSVDTSDLSSAEARIEQLRIKAANNAAGGIRYHADGMILDRPTWIGGRDIAGEAGAEAIIPLTNRRYVQPFAETVADGMLSKLDQMQAGGDTYNITVSAAGDSGDDIARAITRELRAYQLMRSGR